MRIHLFAVMTLTLMLTSMTAVAAEQPLYLDKAYITEDTTWSGTVVLRGQNVVRRGVTLTILPGTVVKFAWIDEDGDDIGDGELTVEGRLVARGTRNNPILFTSAKESPAPKDWTFVQISVSKNSLVEHCIFEYAFSGLQVHYSTATIHQSLFRNNFEGIRFSTTDILIEHNDLLDNYYGIRCEANGSRTTVRNNRFSGNDHAFFPVRKTWETVKVYDNNFEGSKNYQVKLGQTQYKDLDFSNNWWGTSDPEQIAAGFFDKDMEPLLGKVKFEPYLREPVQGAGMAQ